MRQLRLILFSVVATCLRRLRSGPRRPGWTFTFELVVQLLQRDWAELRAMEVGAIRADLAGKPLPRSATHRVRTSESELGGVRALTVEPPERRTDVVILYLHGGSYLFGSPETHLDIASRFALAAGARVVLPDYRLAPEHPFPAQLEDALAAYDALVEDVAPDRVALAGESAGGHLALSVALALAARGSSLPRAVALLSPWLDLTGERATRARCPDDYGDAEMLIGQARLFAGDRPLDDPSISLLDRELRGLPRLLIQVGGAERLREEATDLHERARRAHVDAQLEVLPEMPHAAQLIAEWSVEGQRAIERAAAFLALP